MYIKYNIYMYTKYYIINRIPLNDKIKRLLKVHSNCMLQLKFTCFIFLFTFYSLPNTFGE